MVPGFLQSQSPGKSQKGQHTSVQRVTSMSLEFVKKQMYSLSLDPELLQVAHLVDLDAFLVQNVGLYLR